MIHSIRVFAAAIVLMAALPAFAETVKSSEACNADFQACEKGCWSKHSDALLLRSKCITVCSGTYAACDARAAYEAAKEGASEAYEKGKGVAKDAKEYIHKKTE